MRPSNLERRLKQDAVALTEPVSPHVRAQVRRALAARRVPTRGRPHGRRWPVRAGALAATVGALLLAPALLREPDVPVSVPALAPGPALDRPVAARELALAEEYRRVRRDIDRLRALIDRA